MTTIKSMVVIGAGTMGPGIAQIFAQSGLDVTLVDIDNKILDTAVARIKEQLKSFQDGGVLDAKKVTETIARLKTSTNLAEAVKNVDYVIEAAPEKLELKKSIFKTLDESAANHAILATNTSGFKITEFAAMTSRKDKVLGVHFYNPPHLVPLVEIIRTEHTSDAVVDDSVVILKNAGKAPVKLMDVAGFLHNRLIYALLREAVSMVENKVTTVEDVDVVVREAFGPRFTEVGLFGLVDLVGLDIYNSVSTYLNKDLSNTAQPSKWVGEKVAKGELGVKSGKGFYSWTPEKIAQVRKRLTDQMIARIKRGISPGLA
ncbi:MAG TPA: 3-hydroxyacyl-CoA dehydrogenase NAD-binding domain-containing protein [Candidatus Bathyarchaeia archaeon]|nr:3-hydroxyacyl-CoA dehydrogenase NAD-binding domain-containing protein [Candidatus Bathyarchaeia archaeon]